MECPPLSRRWRSRSNPFHASEISIGSRTASGERFFSTKSRWHCTTSFRASSRFAFASARVSPCEIAAGISSTKQVNPPSLAGSKTAVSFIRLCYHKTVCRYYFVPSSRPSLLNLEHFRRQYSGSWFACRYLILSPSIRSESNHSGSRSSRLHSSF